MQAANKARHEQEHEHASWETSVSTWIDGEGDIRPEELDTPYGRQTWDTYHLIGDVLRNPELAIKPSELFYARLSKAIDAEPHIVAPRGLRPHGSLRVGLSGLAVAAAVASVVWVASPYFSTTTPNEIPALQVAVSEPVVDSSGLRDYLDAHRELAGAGPVLHASFEVSK